MNLRICGVSPPSDVSIVVAHYLQLVGDTLMTDGEPVLRLTSGPRDVDAGVAEICVPTNQSIRLTFSDPYDDAGSIPVEVDVEGGVTLTRSGIWVKRSQVAALAADVGQYVLEERRYSAVTISSGRVPVSQQGLLQNDH